MDPPVGLKANLIQVMSQLPADVAMTGKSAAAAVRAAKESRTLRRPDSITPLRDAAEAELPWKRLILRLCLFHALLLERRQYKGLGWRQPYEFSAADFLSAVKQV